MANKKKKSGKMEEKEESAPTPELKSSLEFTKTRADNATILLIEIFGTVKFLVCCILFFIVWICWNIHFSPLKPFDPFPFPILQMTVSVFAIILSVSVLINQNRQGKIEKIRQQVDFEVNVRAEEEITKVLTMLHEIHQKMGLNSESDKELEEMKEATDIKQIHQTINESETNNIPPDKA
jgi:uncharacterized membrane protein